MVKGMTQAQSVMKYFGYDIDEEFEPSNYFNVNSKSKVKVADIV